MKQTIKTVNKIILTGLLAMALAFSIIGCGDSPNNTDTAGDGECTVNFNLNGGNIDGNTASIQIPVKKGLTIDNLPNPQKANNTFGGWFTGLNGSGNKFETTTVVTSNMTVFAKWTYSGTDGRTVTFDMDGGNIDGNTVSITVTVQSGATIADLPNPQKANNTFGGWFTERNGGGSAFTTSTQVTTNMTVYAKWTSSATPGPGGDGSLGNTLKITNAQVYTRRWTGEDSVEFSPFNGTFQGLNYILYQDPETNFVVFKSLTDAINGTPSVTLIGGKLNVTLGTPKTSVLYSIDSMMAQYPGITVSPSGAKLFYSQGFYDNADDQNKPVVVSQGDGNDGYVFYYYADKAVNVTGKASQSFTEEDGHTYTYTIDFALNLKAGWNSVISTPTSENSHIMKTGTPSANDRWVLNEIW